MHEYSNPHRGEGHHHLLGNIGDTEGHDHDHAQLVLSKNDYVGTIVIFIALSVHSIIAGISLGAATKIEQEVNLVFAVAAHKLLVGIALGNIAFSHEESKAIWTFIICFSLATPVGIFVGYAISASANESAVDLLQASCAGTLLYVSIAEVLVTNKSDTSVNVGFKVVTGLLGFLLMCMLAVWL